MTMKAWRITEAQRLGIRPDSVANRITNGHYPKLKTIRINKRVVYVDTGYCPFCGAKKPTNETRQTS